MPPATFPRMTVDTAAAARRPLMLGSLEEVRDELARIRDALERGTLGTTGNWTPGENMDHSAKFVRFTIDGFPTLAPWPFRFIMRLLMLRRALGPEPIPAGFKLPKQAAVMLPEPGVPDAEGLARLEHEIGRLLAGEKMTAVSPVLGPLTDEQWTILQLKHLALHLSFLTGVPES